MNLKSNLLRVTMLLMAVFATMASQAVNKLYINDFSISDYETVNVPLMVENSDVLTQLQVEVIIPASLEVMTENFVFNKAYLPKFDARAKKFPRADGSTLVKIDIFNVMTGAQLNPGGGTLIELPVAAKAGKLDEGGTDRIELRAITLIDPAAQYVQESDTNTATVTFVKHEEVAPAMSLSCTNAPVVINPSDTRQAEISMTNNYGVMGIDFVISLPEHVTVAAVTGTSRVPADMGEISVVQREDGSVKVMLFGIPGMSDPIAPGEGPLLNISLAADEEFFTGGNVNITRVSGADAKGVSVPCENISFELVSGQVAFEEAYLLIEGENGLNEYITNAINTVAEECPLVADDFSFTPFVNKVQALWNTVEAAFNNYTLTDNFDAIVTEPVANIKQEVDTFVAEARAAEAAEVQRRADNQTAYQGDIAAIDALQAQLDAAKAQIREQYAGFEDEAAEAAVQAQITEMRTAADAAYAAVAEEGNYESVVDAAAVEAAIAALVTDAQAAKAAEEKRVADNKAAHDADIAAIDAQQAALDAAKALIREQYAGFEDEAAEAAVQTQIDALRTAADAAYAAVAEEGNYEYELDTTAVETAIAALVTNAQNAKAAEDARVAANLEAYQADIAAIDALQASLDAAKAEIREQYAGFEDEAAETAVQAQISAMREAVDAAYAAVAEEGNYEYELDTTAVEAAIAALVTNAQNAKAAEDERFAANLEAYQADIAAIDAQQAALDAAKAEIREEYAGFEDEAAEAAVQAQIDALRTEVEAAYAAVAEEGNYEYELDTTAVETAVAALVTDAQAAKAAEDARTAANLEAYQADIAAIDALQATFDAAKAEISETYPDFDNSEKEAEVQALIDALRAEADAAYAAVAEEGNYEYELDTTAVEAAIEAMKEYARENAVIEGDVDASGSIDAVDLVALLNLIANGGADEFDPENPQHKAADMNGDGEINVIDATAIMDLIMGVPMETVRMRMAAAVNEVAAASIYAVETSNANGIRSIRIELSNPAAFVAGQFDLMLPAGMSVISESLSRRAEGMTMVTGNPAAGKHRVVFISNDKEGLAGMEGAVLELEVIGTGNIVVENALFVDNQGNTYTGTDPGTTGIDGIYSADGSQKIYDASGRMVNKLQKGVNIIVNGNGKAEKVYRK